MSDCMSGLSLSAAGLVPGLSATSLLPGAERSSIRANSKSCAFPGSWARSPSATPGRRTTTVEPAGKKGSGPVLTQVYVNQLMPSSWNDTERGEHIGLETKRRTAVQFEDGRVAP
jgi:hypothetical protein